METHTNTKSNKKSTPAVPATDGATEAMAERESKELAQKPTSEVSTHVEPVHHQEVLNSDIIIPSVLLMQGLSDFVADRKAVQGDIVRSTDAKKLGDDKHPITFIPLKMSNSWTITEKVNGKFEFRSIEARNAANEGLPWDFTKNGTDWKRTKTINVFALLPQDVKEFMDEIEKVKAEGGILDLEKTLMPVVISFRSTSFKAGQAVATFFTKVKSNLQYDKTVAPYKYTLSLECEQTENDKGKFFIYKVGAAKAVSKDLIGEAQKWYQILNTATNLKVDMSEEGGSKEGATIDVKEVSQF